MQTANSLQMKKLIEIFQNLDRLVSENEQLIRDVHGNINNIGDNEHPQKAPEVVGLNGSESVDPKYYTKLQSIEKRLKDNNEALRAAFEHIQQYI